MTKSNNHLSKKIEQMVADRLVQTIIDNFATRVDEVAAKKLREPALDQKIEQLTERILDRVLNAL